MQMHQLASLTQMSGKGHMRSTNEIKSVFLTSNKCFYYIFGGSLVTQELKSLIPLVGPLVENPLAVKHLDNRLYICDIKSDPKKFPNIRI